MKTRQSKPTPTYRRPRCGTIRNSQSKARPSSAQPSVIHSIELDRENEADEEQGGSALPRQAGIAGCGIGLSFPDEKEGADRVREDERGRRKPVVQARKRFRDGVVD